MSKWLPNLMKNGAKSTPWAPRVGLFIDLSCLRQYTRTGPRGWSNAKERSRFGSSADASLNRFAMKANIMTLLKLGQSAGCCDMLLSNLSILMFVFLSPGVQGVLIFVLLMLYLSPGVQGCMFHNWFICSSYVLPVARGTGCCNCLKYY